MAQVQRRGHPQQPAERLAQPRGVVHRLRLLDADAVQLRRQRRGSVQQLVAGLEALAQPAGRAAVAGVGEHPRQQLVRRLGRHQLVELVDLLAGQHQARLQLQQRRDQHQELRRRLEVQLPLRLQVVDVGEHDVGEVHLEQIELLAQDQRQQQVEGAGEDVEVELERVDGGAPHAARTLAAASDDHVVWHDPAHGMGGSRILSIEDDPMVRKVLVAVLGERGHEVLEAGDGDSGLQVARDEQPDLILLDLGLPGTHGTVVLGRLRDDPETRKIPVIVVSAWGEGHVVAMARARGAVDVIRKPFGINDLVDRVEAALPDVGAA